MKKTFSFWFLLVAVVAMFNSCGTKYDDFDVNITPNPSIPVTGISLDKTTLELGIGQQYTLTATVTPDDATNPTVTWISDDTTKAIVTDGKVTALAVGTAKITAKAGTQTAICTITITSDPTPGGGSDEQGVVINGVKWATRNVDAPGTFAENPESAGMFYQWNRKIGWSSTNPMINSDGGTDWDTSMPTGTTWETVNDPSPTGWRVPTNEEFLKLLDPEYVTKEMVTLNGKLVLKFTDKANGNAIYLSRNNFREAAEGTIYSITEDIGFYWSSTISSDNADDTAWRLEFTNVSDITIQLLSFINAFNIRPVAQ